MGPAHLEVVLADHFGRIVHASVPREGRVAAEIGQLAVLPEHPHRDVVDHGLQQVLRVLQRNLRLDLFGHVLHRTHRAQRISVLVEFSLALFLDELDPPVRHQQAVADGIGLAGLQ